MKNFDVYNFIYNKLLKEDENENPEDPMGYNPEQEDKTMVAQNNAEIMAKEPPPEQQAQQIKSTHSVFDQFSGASLKNVEFTPHENGGSLKIYTSLSPIPLIISWTGDRVTAKYKNVTALT